MPNELILIIEDDEKSRKLVRDVLGLKGYRTVETDTAEEGIRLAQQQRPALILMDIHLPGMNGIEALQNLRRDFATSAIPVIAVTASVMHDQRQQVTDAGFNALERKPINIADFLKTVRRVLDQTTESPVRK
jgi:two-component system, cell cycle response regulator DivK